jgi:squalene cyclase
MKVADAIYKKGVQYLLDTQRPDGLWFVRSGVFPLQAYFESGFPYGHDQWARNGPCRRYCSPFRKSNETCRCFA